MITINFRDELLSHLGKDNMLCACVTINNTDGIKEIKLYISRTKEDYQKFLDECNFDFYPEDINFDVSAIIWVECKAKVLQFKWDESYVCQCFYELELPRIPLDLHIKN